MTFTIRSLNVVLVGDNLPIKVVDLADFPVPDYTLEEEIRVPVALQATGGPYSLHLVPDRFQTAVNVHDRPIEDRDLQTLISHAEAYLDYVGRRSLIAVGHNIQASIPVTLEGKNTVISHFVNEQNLSSYAGDAMPVVDLRLIYKLGQETRLTQRIDASDAPDQFNLDFNFHFQFKDSESLDANDAISSLPNSVETAVAQAGEFARITEQEGAER